MNEAAVEKLAGLLSKADFQKAFARDHVQAMQAQGIKAADIPREALDALASLDFEELRALANVGAALRKADLPERLIVEMV